MERKIWGMKEKTKERRSIQQGRGYVYGSDGLYRKAAERND
jgi:hypothetical protein